MTTLSELFAELQPHEPPRGAPAVLAAAQRHAAGVRRRHRVTVGLGAIVVASAVGLWAVAEGGDTSVDTDPGPVVTEPTTTDEQRATTTDPTAPSAATVPTVAVEASGHDLLLYGADGITRVRDGLASSVWSEPVAEAFADGPDAVVFQDAGLDGAIRWARGDRVEVLVASDQRTVLHGLVELEGEATILFTRATGGREPGQPEREERLYSRSLVSGTERELGLTGGIESGLDGVGLSSQGLLVSTCHLQCGVRDLGPPGEERVYVQPDWIGGLDVSGDLLAYVRSTFLSEEGTTTDPVLVLAELDGTVRAEVALPDDMTGRIHLDLAGDAGSVVVWSVSYETGEASSPVLVEDPGGVAEQVRRLATDQAARFEPAR